VNDTLARAPVRPVNIGDVMILTAAFAAGLAFSIRPWADVVQWYSMVSPFSRGDWWSWWTAFGRREPPRFLVLRGCVQILFCFIASLTLALVGARLRRPRPPWRQVACQPGFVACVALCATAAIDFELTSLHAVSLPLMLEMALPGLAVLASWLVLLAARRWQPEASWIDRTGRLAGAFWLATIPWSIWVAYPR
jgi:hypothetical protein